MNKPIRRLDCVTLLSLAGITGIAFLVLPVLVVAPVSFVDDRYMQITTSAWSFRWYQNLVSSPQWYQPLLRSMIIATGVALASTALGLAGAYGFAHFDGRLKQVTVLFLLLPLFVPPVVLAVGLLMLFSRLGWVDTVGGLVAAHVALALPYALVVCAAAMSRANLKLEDVACSFGARPVYAFYRATLPQLRTGILSAALLSFVVSFDEPVISLFLTSTKARTLPRQMFDGIRYDLDPTAAAVSSLLVLICIGVAVRGATTRQP